MWYCSLILSLTSITIAGVHSTTLLRLSSAIEWEPKLHLLVARKLSSLKWKQSKLQSWVWQSPMMMMYLSVILFIAGLSCMIWEKAMAVHLHLGSDEMKVSTHQSAILRENAPE
jgi:hypothetical protein